MFGAMGNAITPDLSKGGEIDGDITIGGDLTVTGSGTYSYDELVDGDMQVNGTMTVSSANVSNIERTSSVTNAVRESLYIRHATSGNMANGFGSGLTFQNKDSAGAYNDVGHIQAVMANSDDDTANLIFQTESNGTASTHLTLGYDLSSTFAGAGSFAGAISANGGISLPEGQKLFYGGTSRAVGSNTANIQVDADVSEGGGISMVRNSANANGVTLTLGKSRGNSHNESNVVQDDDVLGVIEFAGADGTDITPQGASISALVDGTPGSNVMPGSLVFATTKASEQTPTTALTVDSSQNSTFVGDILGSSDIIGSGDIVGLFTKHILHGSANSIRVGSQEAQVQIKTNHQHTASLSLHQSHNNANAPKLTLGKSRDNNVDTVNVAVVDNDLLGTIEFAGCDGTDINTIGANIVAKVNGTPGGNDMPTELIFSTTADGASSPTVAFSLDSSQNAIFSGGNIKTDADSRIFPSTGTSTTSTVFGKLAGVALESGAVENILIGEGSGKSITTGDGNVVIGGKDVLDDVTTGSDNIAIGRFVLQKTDTDISGIVAIGKQAMGFALGGNGTVTSAANGAVVVGNEAGLEMTTSAGTVFIGNKVGFEHRAGNNNTIVGSDAFDNTNAVANASNTGLGQSVFGGSHAGASTGNVAIGVASMNGAINGADFNTCMGVSSGTSITTGDQNIAIGYQTMSNATLTGSNNIGMGYRALFAATGCSNLISIGAESGSGNLTNAADGSIFIGAEAGKATTTGSECTFIGFHAGKANTTGNQHTFIGFEAGIAHNHTEGNSNSNGSTFIGYRAGYEAIMGSQDNTFVGASAGLGTKLGDGNVMVGFEVGKFQGFSSASTFNTAIGLQAFYGGGSNTGGANSNTCIGYKSGYAITTGDSNTLVGYESGNGINTGSNNTGLGNEVTFDVDADNQTAIGNGATTDSANDISIGNTSVDEVKGQVDFSTFSDKRIKKDIVDNDLGLDFINNLKPRKFKKVNPAKYPKSIKRKNDGLNQTWTEAQANKVWDGLIAQEVKEAIDKAGTTFSGWNKESNSKQLVSYSTLVIPLIKAVQELTKRVKELESK